MAIEVGDVVRLSQLGETYFGDRQELTVTKVEDRFVTVTWRDDLGVDHSRRLLEWFVKKDA